MGTTTKMAIPYPEATGLVKDGWEDMKDIATQVDAKTGLVLLNTTAFSAVASQSVNDVFSSNYRNYRIILNATGSTNLDVNLRLRVSGTDTTTGYRRQTLNADSTTISGERQTADTSWVGALAALSGVKNIGTLEVFQPFETEVTSAMNYRMLNTNGNILFRYSAFGIDVTTSYTGFSLICSTGNITGSVSTYGFNV